MNATVMNVVRDSSYRRRRQLDGIISRYMASFIKIVNVHHMIYTQAKTGWSTNDRGYPESNLISSTKPDTNPAGEMLSHSSTEWRALIAHHPCNISKINEPELTTTGGSFAQ